jgi:hypothetical protein
MKLTPAEIKQHKQLFGTDAVNFFMRYIEAVKRWKHLPSEFIINALKHSEDLPINNQAGTRINRTLKRKIKNKLGNRTTKIHKGN